VNVLFALIQRPRKQVNWGACERGHIVAKLLVFPSKLRSGASAHLDAELSNCRRLLAEIKERRREIDRALQGTLYSSSSLAV
jgi:hypothetical protein